ncbi:MAG: acyl-CoA thioesterase [Chitinophagaceae bacterium]|nr:acyl-CoA thioesterase [Chitinophagaceae bacterium]
MTEEVWHVHVQRVSYKETDQMRVVHHANYVNWFEIGRTEWMRESGLPYSKVESLGLLLPVLDLQVKYFKSAFYDDCVAIYTRLNALSAIRLGFYYEARKIENREMTFPQNTDTIEKPEGELLATGSTQHMWVNAEWKPVRVPQKAPEIFALLKERYRY